MSARLELPYRYTGRNGRTIGYVIADGGKELKPVYRKRSRSGGHGCDIWELEEGARVHAIIYDRSHSGHESIEVFEVVVREGKTLHRTLGEQDVPEAVVAFLNKVYPAWRYF